MKLPISRLSPRWLTWLNLPTVSLLALLQRAPVASLVETAESVAVRAPLGVVLKSAAALAASLGAVHSLAGATALTATSPSPLAAKVGTKISQVGLGVKGTETPAKSFTISGQLAPGLTLQGSTTTITSATTLPVVLDGTALALNGTPTTAGTYTLNLVAWEFASGKGISSSKFSYQVVVSGGTTTTAPSITTQPKTQTVVSGKAVTLSVAASGSPAPTYQWKKGTTTLAGKTAATLTFAAIKTTDAGSYTCVVTNSAGTATSKAAVITVKAIPGKPTSVTAAAASATSVKITWKAPASTTVTKPTGYKVQRATNSAFTTGKVTYTLGAVTSYTNTGLKAKATYYYRVYAVTIAGNSAPSTAAKVVTPSALPASPTSVTATALNATSIKVAWKAPTGTTTSKPTGYKVQRATNSAFTAGAVTYTLGAVTSYTNTGLKAKTTYYYRVYAYTAAGNSAPTTAVKVVTAASVVSGTSVGTTATGTTSSTAGAARLSRVISRVYCGTGADVATGGFTVTAGAPRTVLIRAVGPTLASLGVTNASLLQDPQLDLYDAKNTKIATDDDWAKNTNATALAVAAADVGATPFATTDAKSAALLVTLAPGNYTFTVSGKAGGKGIVLIEVYDVP